MSLQMRMAWRMAREREKGARTSGIYFSAEGCELTLCLPAWLVAYSAQSPVCLNHGQGTI